MMNNRFTRKNSNTKRYSRHSTGLFSNLSGRNASAVLAILCFLSKSTEVMPFSVQRNKNVNSINRIVFGTAALSKAEDPLGMLDAAYAKGVRRFDLARTYGMGESERIFGEWFKSRKIERESINIITKGGIGMDGYGDPNRPLLTKDDLFQEVELSMSTLNVENVDLYMFHRDDARLDVSDFVDWINAIVETGKIGRWGVSNWSFDRFRAAHKYATDNGLVPPSANSPQFSLAAPSQEVWPSTQSISQPDHVSEIEWYESNGVELLCWEVLAKGFMAKGDLWKKEDVDCSKFSDVVERGTDEWRLQRIQQAYCNDENYRRRELAIHLAKESGLKLAQIAMLYPLTKGKHISVIFGSSKPDHLDDMVKLQHFNIDDAAMASFLDPAQYVVNNGSHKVQRVNISAMSNPKTKTVPFVKDVVLSD